MTTIWNENSRDKEREKVLIFVSFLYIYFLFIYFSIFFCI